MARMFTIDNGTDDVKFSLDTGKIEPESKATIISKKDFDINEAKDAFKEFYAEKKDEDERLFYLTEPHIGSAERMGLFGDYAPSVVNSLNRYHNMHLPFRESNMTEFGYSKLCHLYCTLDKSIMFNYFNRHSAMSKIHNLNSVAKILGRPELSLDDSVLGEGVDTQTIVDMLFKVKRNATRLMRDVVIGTKDKIVKNEVNNTYEYPKKINELLGGNLVDIILYGSSAKGEGKDYDNIVVPKILPNNLYDIIHGKGIKEKDKEVGMIFVPEDVLEKFLYVNVSNTLFRDHAKVLMGKVSFPVESERYVRFKEMYHAGFGSAKLLSALNLAFRMPEIFFDKPGLFEYFMKLNRFTYHGLLMKDGYKIVDKDHILGILRKEYDFPIPEFKPDIGYIQDGFLKANKTSVEIAKRMYTPKTSESKNEVFAKANNRISYRIFKSTHDDKDLYIFRQDAKIRINDMLPVQIITNDMKEYKGLMHELKLYTKDKDILIGQRK